MMKSKLVFQRILEGYKHLFSASYVALEVLFGIFILLLPLWLAYYSWWWLSLYILHLTYIAYDLGE